MTKVIIAGAAGRMGRRIGYMVNEHPELQIAAGFERPDNPDVGKDLGELGGYGTNGVKVANDLAAVIDQGDVIIDFTFHEATMKIARQAALKNRAMVIGTTGLSQENIEELTDLCKKFPCVQAPNMAVGVNVLFKLAAKVASILGNDYDMEIVEAHHRHNVLCTLKHFPGHGSSLGDTHAGYRVTGTTDAYYDHYKYQFDFESNTYTIDKVLDSNVKKKWEISYSSEFAATKIIKKTETLEQAKEYIKKCVQSQCKLLMLSAFEKRKKRFYFFGIGWYPTTYCRGKRIMGRYVSIPGVF